MAKPTLELPADLLRRVKARAAAQGRSIPSPITDAHDSTFRQAKPRAAGWRSVFGRAKSGSTRDMDRRVKELRCVDPRDWE